MIRTALNTSAPILASAGLYGITDSQIGMGLLIIMALCVIANQIWTFAERVRGSVRSSPPDTSSFTTHAQCRDGRDQILQRLSSLREEDARQDKISQEHYDAVTAALGELRVVQREDAKGLHKRIDLVLRAVSRLEGRVGGPEGDAG